jgi:hypothetical protein
VTRSQPAPVWRRSQRCDTSACVEVAQIAGGIALRDSTRPDDPVLHFSQAEWTSFLAGLRAAAR